MLRRVASGTINLRRLVSTHELSKVRPINGISFKPSIAVPMFRSCTSTTKTEKEANSPTLSAPPTPVLPFHIVDNPRIQAALPYLATVGYLILASGMAMTDVLMLRVGLATGYVTLVGFHAFQYRPLRIPLAASIFYVILNTAWACKIFLERQVSLTDDERRIHEEFFRDDMVDYEFEKIIRAGEVTVTADKPVHLLKAGDMHENLFFILDGRMEVTFADESHVHINKSEFMGEGSFIGEVHKSRSNVHALAGCKYVKWDLVKLKELCAKDPHARRAVEVKVGRELAHKLKATSDRLTHAEHQLMVMRLCFGTKKDNVEDALEEAFKQADTDGGGSIEWDEFVGMMRRFDDPAEPLSELQLSGLFAHIDEDGSGEISLEEFLHWMKA